MKRKCFSVLYPVSVCMYNCVFGWMVSLPVFRFLCSLLLGLNCGTSSLDLRFGVMFFYIFSFLCWGFL